MDKEQIERLMSSHEHRAKSLHEIANLMEGLGIPPEDVLRILENIQNVEFLNRKEI